MKTNNLRILDKQHMFSKTIQSVHTLLVYYYHFKIHQLFWYEPISSSIPAFRFFWTAVAVVFSDSSEIMRHFSAYCEKINVQSFSLTNEVNKKCRGIFSTISALQKLVDLLAFISYIIIFMPCCLSVQTSSLFRSSVWVAKFSEKRRTDIFFIIWTARTNFLDIYLHFGGCKDVSQTDLASTVLESVVQEEMLSSMLFEVFLRKRYARNHKETKFRKLYCFKRFSERRKMNSLNWLESSTVVCYTCFTEY